MKTEAQIKNLELLKAKKEGQIRSLTWLKGLINTALEKEHYQASVIEEAIAELKN